MATRFIKNMTGLTAIAVLGAALAGCASGGNGNSNGTASPSPSQSAAAPSETASALPSPSADSGADILAAFQAKIKDGASAAELNAMLDSELAKTQPDTADELLRGLLAYYDAHLEEAGQPLQEDGVQQALLQLKWPPTDDAIAALKNEKARTAAQETIAGGYKLETAEGFIFPVVDYGKLKRFDAYATPAMRDYIALLATESDAKTAADGGLVISWPELADRALAAEQYVRDYPDSKEKNAAGSLYLQYVRDLLIGLDNTPIFDFDTFKLNADVKAEYEKIVAEHANTTTGELVQSFLNVMGKTKDAVFKKGAGGQQQNIPEVQSFRDGIEPHVESELGIANPNK